MKGKLEIGLTLQLKADGREFMRLSVGLDEIDGNLPQQELHEDFGKAMVGLQQAFDLLTTEMAKQVSAIKS